MSCFISGSVIDRFGVKAVEQKPTCIVKYAGWKPRSITIGINAKGTYCTDGSYVLEDTNKVNFNKAKLDRNGASEEIWSSIAYMVHKRSHPFCLSSSNISITTKLVQATFQSQPDRKKTKICGHYYNRYVSSFWPAGMSINENTIKPTAKT